jgi:hypothetical protein
MTSMWRTDTHWFDVTIATTVLMLGHLYFGRFEEHRPRWRRLLKSLLVIAMLVGTSAWAGRGWMFALLGAMTAGVLVIHAWWLPRHGVNGWTAEPRDRYYALFGLDPSGKPRDRAD